MKATKEEKIEAKTEPGTYATTIWVFYEDRQEDDKGLVEFKSKPEFDQWLKTTSVNVLRVIRGREKKISTRVVFQ